MDMYLMTYRIGGEDFTAQVCTMHSIATTIGASDYTDDSDFRVYRLLPNTDPQPLRLSVEHKVGGVYLEDRWGNQIDHAYYEAH